ncbi:hypothetical protein EJQ19_25150 [Paenibacillus whitsoniae]|uniref:Uncharacterized protein n=1 Tax=Paenibacillus whitsoniae TaxID=2496558 RepID=A0A430J7L6_9BACL|nr:hypothetical protein EJQ19_25150 [Paenibacillus whitsoniae]
MEPRYDEFGIPLARSGVSGRIWALCGMDMDAFEQEVEQYFARGYPGWKVAAISFDERIIWLKDVRRSRRHGR